MSHIHTQRDLYWQRCLASSSWNAAGALLDKNTTGRLSFWWCCGVWGVCFAYTGDWSQAKCRLGLHSNNLATSPGLHINSLEFNSPIYIKIMMWTTAVSPQAAPRKQKLLSCGEMARTWFFPKSKEGDFRNKPLNPGKISLIPIILLHNSLECWE